MGGEKTKRTRIILTKAGLDGHDSMITVLREYFIEQGFEVFYFGLYRKAADIAEIAIQEGVDYLGLSVHSGAHLEYIKEIFEHLKNRGALEIKLVVGGIISEEDKKILEEQFGVNKVFVSGMPGTDLKSIREFFEKSEKINGENQKRNHPALNPQSKYELSVLISWLANFGEETYIRGVVEKSPDKPELLIGVTGSAAAGKSSLIGKMIQEFRKRGKKVGVISIDPSEPAPGGARLGGDRTRMWSYLYDDDVFIYSMATRGCPAGIAPTTANTIKILAIAGYDVVIVETIGVGQDQVEIKNIVDKTILVLTPDVGEDQVFKSGLMQIADAYVINKTDLLDAQLLEKALNKMLDEKAIYAGDKKRPPVFKTSANRDENNGVLELVDYLLECSCGNDCSCKI